MRLTRIFLCAALLTLAAVVAAQTLPGDMIVEVPFAFFVDGQSLPAGHYIVKVVDEARVRIVGDKNTGMYVSTHTATRTKSDGTKLVFHRYGSTYFLSAMWISGNTTGREMFPSRAEHELAEGKAGMELAVVRPVK